MADDGDARVAEVYADSDSGEDFYGFGLSDQASSPSSSSASENESDSVAVSESESESDGVVASGVRRGRGRGRGRDRQAQGDGVGDGGLHPTLPDGSQVIWQPDVGVAASDQWLPRLPNDASEPAFDGTNFRPIDFFFRTFPLVLLNLLCTETNRYFSQWSQQPGVAVNESIRKAWFDVDVPEMRVFIAVLIFMGLDRRYSYRSYWSTHWMLGMPGFRSIMPRDRFFAILRFLHVCDNSTAVQRGQPGHDRAFKIRSC